MGLLWPRSTLAILAVVVIMMMMMMTMMMTIVFMIIFVAFFNTFRALKGPWALAGPPGRQTGALKDP